MANPAIPQSTPSEAFFFLRSWEYACRQPRDERDAVMSDQNLRRTPSWHQMHHDPTVTGVWSGYGSDLSPRCGQSEQIMVTNVVEAVDCEKCLRIMNRLDA